MFTGVCHGDFSGSWCSIIVAIAHGNTSTSEANECSTTLFNRENQQGAAVQHREPCSGWCASLAGSGGCRRMDTCTRMAESLHCSPETITTLSISYSPIQNKKFKNKEINKMRITTKALDKCFLWMRFLSPTLDLITFHLVLINLILPRSPGDAHAYYWVTAFIIMLFLSTWKEQ